MALGSSACEAGLGSRAHAGLEWIKELSNELKQDSEIIGCPDADVKTMDSFSQIHLPERLAY